MTACLVLWMTVALFHISEKQRVKSLISRALDSIPDTTASSFTMARKTPAKEQIVKLIVGAGQASPSPPVGPALGSKGVKSMDFCKVCTQDIIFQLISRAT